MCKFAPDLKCCAYCTSTAACLCMLQPLVACPSGGLLLCTNATVARKRKDRAWFRRMRPEGATIYTPSSLRPTAKSQTPLPIFFTTPAKYLPCAERAQSNGQPYPSLRRQDGITEHTTGGQPDWSCVSKKVHLVPERQLVRRLSRWLQCVCHQQPLNQVSVVRYKAGSS